MFTILTENNSSSANSKATINRTIVDTLSQLTISKQSKATSKWKYLASCSTAIASSEKSCKISNFEPLKRFKDGAIPITYKEGYVNNKPTTNLLTHYIIAKRYEAHYKILPLRNVASTILEEGHLLADQAPYRGLRLVKTSEKKWLIYDPVSGSEFSPDPQQKYIFVTMPDKTIRIALEQQGGHSLLSDNARYVRYAGTVSFDDKQRIAHWDNQSGAYYPPPFLARQANFEDGLSRFEAKYDRNVENCSTHQKLSFKK